MLFFNLRVMHVVMCFSVRFTHVASWFMPLRVCESRILPCNTLYTMRKLRSARPRSSGVTITANLMALPWL